MLELDLSRIDGIPFFVTTKNHMKTYHIDLEPDEVDGLTLCLDALNPSCIEDAILQGLILQILDQTENEGDA